MYNKDSHLQSKQIHIDSRHLDNENITNFEFLLNESIDVDNDHDIILNIEHIEIPLSRYNINGYNNNFKIRFYTKNEIENITIEEGNYNVYELVNYLNNVGSEYLTFKYDKIKNWLYFISETPFYIVENNTREIFDFVKNQYSNLLNGYYYIYSNVNLSGISSLYIHSSTFSNNNLLSRDDASDVILKLPLNRCNNEIFIWENNGSHKLKLHEKKIHKINLKLTDEYNNEFLIQENSHYNITLTFEFVKTKTPDHLKNKQKEKEQKENKKK